MMLLSPTVNTLARLGGGIASRIRNAWFRARGVRITGYVWMRAVEIPRQHRSVLLRGPCALDRGVVLLCSGPKRRRPKIRIAEKTYINRGTFIDASLSIRIERDVAIGPGCYITDHDHQRGEGCPLEGSLDEAPVRIGRGAWIGAHCVILKGLAIGEGAVVGAGSVVTRSVPRNAVAAGNPARIIKKGC